VIPAAAPALSNARVVFVNAEEFKVLAEAVDLVRLPAIVISGGPRPVTFMRFGRVVAALQPPEARPIDVTGAGDTLAGTFLAATARGLTDTNALQAGINAASEAIRCPGIPIGDT
jgi:sugar/nucleoside kinase (ribokinase family)